MQLELFYKDTCPFCQKVLRFIDKNNLRDKIGFKDIIGNEENLKVLVEEGGKNQVPCLFIDKKPMYESDDIIAFLNDNLVNA
ncbi:MAG: glutaredoxin [Finegoldia sp.]|nr:glutaredoxin [Finegoldia sp.]